jgi:Skp family chaperone for outer membrane proteins
VTGSNVLTFPSPQASKSKNSDIPSALALLRFACAGAIALSLVAVPQSLLAQTTAPAQNSAASQSLSNAPLSTFALPDVPVLTIEPDQLFSLTKFGQRLAKDLDKISTQLARENRSIESALADEETDLTERRSSLPAAEFRDLADAFDEKVQSLRVQQDEKSRDLTRQTDQAQRAFLSSIAPILQEIMVEKGASVVLDRRAVFLSADASDVTIAAIKRIDARIADGVSLDELMRTAAQPEPEPSVDVDPPALPEPATGD